MTALSAERRAAISASLRARALRREPERIAQFWTLVDKTADCWLWKGDTNNQGYGQFSFRGGNQLAHRLAYLLLRGEIGPNMTLDHIVCDRRLCVNPFHVVEATSRANCLRSSSPAALNARKTHCLRGHAFTPENTRATNGARVCRTCERQKCQRLRAAKRYRAAAETGAAR